MSEFNIETPVSCSARSSDLDKKSSKIKKTRRSHKNSKLGCVNCKKNQIKCDETLPICNNCQRKDLPCSYLFMPPGEFQQLIHLMELRESSDILIESSDKLYDTTLQHAHYSDKIEMQETINIRPPTKRRQLALRVKKSENSDAEGPDLLSDEDPILKFANNNSNQDQSQIPKIVPHTVNYLTLTSGSSVFKQYDCSPVPSPASSDNQQYITLPDQPNVRMVSLQENLSNCKHTSFQLNSCINNPQFFAEWNRTSDNSFINNLGDHYHNLTRNTPLTHDFDDYQTGKIEKKISSSNLGISGNNPNTFQANDYSDNNTDTDYETDVEGEIENDNLNYKSLYETVKSMKSFASDIFEDCLPGARVASREIKMNPRSEFEWFDPFLKKLMTTFLYVRGNAVSQLFKEWGRFDIDALFEKVYRVQMNVTPMFSMVLRTTTLLFVYDTIKNTLCKQKTILPLMPENMRVSICGQLEEFSIKALSKLSVMINNEYLPRYNTFIGGQREVLFSGFLSMSGCTALHYNSGYRQSMSIEQSKQCIEFIGIFTAGMFSVMISENDRKISDQHDMMMTYSKHLLLYSKNLIVLNYNSELFTEIFSMFKSLELNREENLKKKVWSSCYINLYIFLEKHSHFLKLYRDHTSLLGFDKGYTIRLINEWYQIFPYDLMNIAYIKFLDGESEKLALVHLTFLAIRYYLEALIPGIRSFIRNSFAGGEKFGYDSTATLMRLFKLFNKKEHKIYAMYMIRFSTFFSLRFDRLKSILSRIRIPEFSDAEEMTNTERCERLFRLRKYGQIVSEVQKLSMSLKRASCIEERNYPSINKSSSLNRIKDAEKIAFKSTYEILTDFTKTGSGFLSIDYDPRAEILNMSSVTTVIDEIDLKSKERVDSRHMVSTISNQEVNSCTMRNCWAIETSIKLGLA